MDGGKWKKRGKQEKEKKKEVREERVVIEKEGLLQSHLTEFSRVINDLIRAMLRVNNTRKEKE